jgi:hypothetical protein
MALIWLEKYATQRGIRGCEEVIIRPGYVADAAAICGLQYQYHKKWVGDRKPNDFSDDFTFIFETKVSRSDFLKTFINDNHIGSRLQPISNFHYVVTTKKIVAEQEIPAFWGLIEEYGRGLRIVKEAVYSPTTKQQLHEFGYTLLRSGHSSKFTYNMEVQQIQYPGSDLFWNEKRVML